MKGHDVIGANIVNRHPPVDLGEGRRVPGVAVRMKCVGDARSKIVGRKSGAQPGNIKVCLFQIAPALGKQLLDEFFGFGVVNKFWFQLGQDLHTPLDWHISCTLRGSYGWKAASTNSRANSQNFSALRRRRVDEHRSAVQFLAPLCVIHLRITEKIHCLLPP